MIGNIHKITKRNLLKGIPWRFGPNWPGQRCYVIYHCCLLAMSEKQEKKTKEMYIKYIDINKSKLYNEIINNHCKF